MATNAGHCLDCGSIVRWSGKHADRPDCPKCGYRPPLAELQQIDLNKAEVKRLVSLQVHGEPNGSPAAQKPPG